MSTQNPPDGNHRLNFKFNPPTPASGELLNGKPGLGVPTFVRRNFNFKTGKPLPPLPPPPAYAISIRGIPTLSSSTGQPVQNPQILWQRRSLNAHWPRLGTGDFALRRKNSPVTLQQQSVRQAGGYRRVLQRKTGRGVFRGAQNFRVIVRVVNSGRASGNEHAGLQKSVDSIRLTVGGCGDRRARGENIESTATRVRRNGNACSTGVTAGASRAIRLATVRCRVSRPSNNFRWCSREFPARGPISLGTVRAGYRKRIVRVCTYVYVRRWPAVWSPRETANRFITKKLLVCSVDSAHVSGDSFVVRLFEVMNENGKGDLS